MRKFAVGLYSVRDELAKDMWGTLRKLKVMGYDGVEFFGNFPCTAQELRAALDECGLECVGWHTALDQLSDDKLMATISYNKVLGNSDIVIPWMPEEMRKDKAAYQATAKKFDAMAEKLAEHGMYLGYHNHTEEFEKSGGEVPFCWLYDNSKRLQLQLDNGNALGAGPDTDIYGPISQYPNRIRTIHHKHYSHKDGIATMIGKDDVDWARTFKLCDEYQDIKWHIVEYECESMYSQLEGVKLCITALRSLEEEGKI